MSELVDVALIGARLHYGAPIAFHRAGSLGRFYSDFFLSSRQYELAKKVSTYVASSTLAKARGRYTAAIPQSKVIRFTSFGLRYFARQKRAANREALYEAHRWASETFGRKVADQADFSDTVYAFNTAALEIFGKARKNGRKCVLEQTIAPMAIEEDLLGKEETRWPQWATTQSSERHASWAKEREATEWDMASLIVCPSTFVLDGVVSLGVPHKKCVLVPYGLAKGFGPSCPDYRPPAKRIRVLTVGAVGLRKGSPWLLEVARRLGAAADFRLIGKLDAPSSVVHEFPPNLQYLGEVPRVAMKAHFDWADLFFLPSICEGSALVCFEALSFGRPVVCTPNTGAVVKHGHDGLVIPPGDIDAMIDAILTAVEGSRHRYMFEAARKTAMAHDLDAYCRNLNFAVGKPGVQ